MRRLIILAILLGSALATYYWSASPKSKQIAIVNTISHPALDLVRQAFIDRIKAHLPDLEVLDYNAQGSLQEANLIASQIAHNDRVIGVFTIGTLAAQTLAKAESNKPIVIAAVSDPKVITSKNQAANACGVTDNIDAAYQIDAIIELLPSLKTLSVLYTPHEANSASMVKNLEAQARARGLSVELVGVHEAQQIMSSSMLACQKGDAVLIPLDNQLVAAMPTVIKATKNSPCPIISSNESPLHQGATIGFGVDYHQSGTDGADIMVKILNQKQSPRDIGFINPEHIGLYLNEKVALEKGLTLNPDLKLKVVTVKGGD